MGTGRTTRLAGWAFVAPALALLLAVNVFPLLYSLGLSFTNAETSGGARAGVGGRNYATVFARPEYAAALRTTGVFVVAAVTTELLLGFGLALALRRAFRGKGAVLTLLLVPMMLSPAVVGIFWGLILNGSFGIVNQVLGLAITHPPLWLTDPRLKLCSLILIDVWMWTPFMMLVALAGLNAIPRALEEAARIDRASEWVIFRRLTLPLCAPFLLLAVLFRTTDALKQFDLVMAVTGPNDASTQTLSALLFQVVFSNDKLGLGSAFSFVALVIVIALASVFTRYLAARQST